GSFGGEKWISYYYTLDTPNFETLRDSPNCPPTCPGTFLGSVDFRAPSVKSGLDVEEPGTLKPMRSQELSFGFERQLSNLMSASVRFVHKQLDRAIDDIGDLCPPSECGAGAETYIIANPGEGLVDQFDISTGTSLFRPQGFSANPQLIAMPKATRNYNAVEFALTKRLANRWMFYGSYAWTRDAGNYSGLSSSDENGRDNPNNPPTRDRGRGSEGRTPFLTQSDLYVQHGFRIGGGREIQINATLLNLFNQRTVLDKVSTIRRTGAIPLGPGFYTEAQFYAGQLDFDQLINTSVAAGRMTLNPQFLLANRYQDPIQARFGVRFTF